MRAIVCVLFVLVVSPAVAWAQPGSTPVGPTQPAPPQPYPPEPYPQPYPPQPYPPPVYQQPYYPYPIQLTPDEQRLLAKGEISLGQHAGGVVANWLFGFGIGQAIQGRWGDTGWIFTLGEAGSITAMIVGVTRLSWCIHEDDSCNDDRNGEAGVLIVGGLIGYAVFHVWSIIDAAVGPGNHNRKVREVKRKAGIPVMGTRQIVPHASPSPDGGGTVGLTFRF